MFLTSQPQTIGLAPACVDMFRSGMFLMPVSSMSWLPVIILSCFERSFAMGQAVGATELSQNHGNSRQGAVWHLRFASLPITTQHCPGFWNKSLPHHFTYTRIGIASAVPLSAFDGKPYFEKLADLWHIWPYLQEEGHIQ